MPSSLKGRDRFLTEATIRDGYLAPQYLIAGLMSEFEDDWQPVISEFLVELTRGSSIPNSELKRIQLFTFDCWLLWGPSVPIGCCQRWLEHRQESVIALQYGYGDENNSLPLLPLLDGDQDFEPYARLLDYVTSSPLAIKAEVKVRPVWIAVDSQSRNRASAAMHKESEIDRSLKKLGGAQRRIRSPRPTIKPSTGRLVLDYASAPFLRGRSRNEVPEDQETYYSSYIWVMLVICKKTADGSNPAVYQVTADGRAGSRESRIIMNVLESPWLGMFPFFEHGNIADDGTYFTGKNQLAHKVLAAIDLVLQEELPDKRGRVFGDDFVFRYACASDDANCPKCDAVIRARNAPLHPRKFKSSTTIRSILETLLGKTEDEGSQNGPFQHLRQHIILDSNGWDDRETFSACHLPDIVDLFYYQLVKSRAK